MIMNSQDQYEYNLHILGTRVIVDYEWHNTILLYGEMFLWLCPNKSATQYATLCVKTMVLDKWSSLQFVQN